MLINKEQLLKIYPLAKARVDIFLEPLNKAMDRYEINTPLRMAAFLAQIGHESGQLRYVRELASGEAYEGRVSLGNVNLGDGVRYKGRGLIQITGRANYAQVEKELGVPCVASPELLETPENACLTAAWFWDSRMLNDLADKRDLIKITKKINGGLNGIKDREELYGRALKVLL